MTLNTVTLKWNIPDLTESGLAATLSITPTAQMSDSTDHVLIAPVVRQVVFSGGTGQLTGIVANDNTAILPAGTGYLISVTAETGQVIVAQFQTQLNFANGATQWLDTLAPVPVVTTSFQYLPLPAGTPVAGQVPVATGAGDASAWGTPLSQVAATGTGGFALQNGAPSILSWTAPADGNPHVVSPFGNLRVTSAETGGVINLAFTDPGGNAGTAQLDAGGHGSGTFTFNAKQLVVGSGTTVTLTQTALTGGAAVVYAALWAA